MPRLLQINSTANWGSTGKIAEQIGERAIEHGWESYIAYGRYANKSKSHLIRIGSRLGQAWHLIISRLLDRHGLGSVWATKRLIKQIKKINPDVIHLHNLHGYYINYKLLFEYLNSTDTPIVWTLHDCWSFTGHCAHFVEAGCYRWQDRCSDCPLLRQYPKSLHDRTKRNFKLKQRLFTANKNLTLVPVSNWLAGFIPQSLHKQHQHTIIHNGINIDVFKPTRTTEHKHINILGVSSVWDDSKGLGDFYQLRELLSSERYDITLVGLTSEQIAALPRGIQGRTRTNSIDELVNLYNEADIFINPTYADTFPTTNLEAMACGTPVITYRTGGSPESISPDTGVVVEQGSIDGIVRAIDEFAHQSRRYYSEVCRRRAVEHYDKNICFERYITLYNELLTKKQQ